MTASILCERHDSVATVTINRPERRNAMDRSSWQSLADIFDDLSRDTGLRCVIVTGAGGGLGGSSLDIPGGSVGGGGGSSSGAVEGSVAAALEWRITWSVPALFALIVLSIMYFYAPPSPRWLVLQGRIEESRAAMRFLRPALTEDQIKKEVEEIKNN